MSAEHIPLAGRLPAVILALAGAGCSAAPAERGPHLDPDYTRHSEYARVAFDRGSLDRAALLYRRALERARAMDAPLLIGDSAYNLAACEILRGSPDAAELLREAEAEFARAGRPVHEVRLLSARIELTAGREGEARKLVEDVVEDASLGDARPALAEALLFRARLNCRAGEMERARADLERGARIARRLGHQGLEAAAVGVRGEVLLREGRGREASARFDDHADRLRRIGHYRDMCRALGRSGAALEAAGEERQAALRYYRAARSLLYQGRAEEARRLALRALGIAEEAGEQALARRLKDLGDKIPGPRTSPTE